MGGFFCFFLICDLILARRRLQIETPINIHERGARECVAPRCKEKGGEKKGGGGLYFLPGSLLLATPLLPPVYPPCAGEAKLSCAVAGT